MEFNAKSQRTSLNFVLGTLQTGHLSGTSPTTLFAWGLLDAPAYTLVDPHLREELAVSGVIDSRFLTP
jgi:hypothetical protein